MSSISGNTDESLTVGETTRSIITTHNYGVAGNDTPHLTDYNQRVNVLLCDAIKAKWDTTLYGNDPTPSFPSVLNNDLNFLTTWFTGSKDVEIIFKEGFDDKPLRMRSTDWRLQGHITTVDIHTFVRGGGGDIEPPEVGKVIRGLDKVIALNHTNLIPNARVDMASVQPAPTENQDDLQSLWHSLIKVRVQYFKVRTV